MVKINCDIMRFFAGTLIYHTHKHTHIHNDKQQILGLVD